MSGSAPVRQGGTGIYRTFHRSAPNANDRYEIFRHLNATKDSAFTLYRGGLYQKIGGCGSKKERIFIEGSRRLARPNFRRHRGANQGHRFGRGRVAFRIALTSAASSKGLKRSAIGLASRISRLVCSSSRPVISMVGNRVPAAAKRLHSSIPFIPGRYTSDSTQVSWSGRLFASSSSALKRTTTLNPRISNSVFRARQTEASSSITITVVFRMLDKISYPIRRDPRVRDGPSFKRDYVPRRDVRATVLRSHPRMGLTSHISPLENRSG